MASKAVRILGSSIIAPSTETPHRSLWLTNFDLSPRPRLYTPTIYLYRSKSDEGSTSFFSTDRLKEGLAKVLVLFYPYAGMFGFDDDGRVELKCTGQGVKLVEAVCDSTIDEFGDFSPSKDLRELMVPATPPAEPPCPIFLFQVTRFKCGGVCLGMAMHHIVGDGTSSFYFINSWAAVTRGVDINTVTPPYIDCTNLRARSPLRVEYDHCLLSASKSDTNSQVTELEPSSSSVVLRISKDQLAKLKGSNKRMTTFVAIASRAWQCTCKARGLAANEVTRLTFPVNIRSRLQPPLPPEYLGNAIWCGSVESEVGELLSSSIDSIASKIQASTSRLDDGYLRSIIDFLEQEDGPTRGARTVLPCHLHAISWLSLPMYEADFGWGRPTLMQPAEPPFRGCMSIIRDPSGDGGVNLIVPVEDSESTFMKHFFTELI